MEDEKHIALTQRMDRYASGLMPPEEQAAFEAEIQSDRALKAAFESFLLGQVAVMQHGIEAEKTALKAGFSQIDPGAPAVPLWQKPFALAVAAVVILLVIAGIWMLTPSPQLSSEQLFTQHFERPRIPETMGGTSDQLLREAYLAFAEGNDSLAQQKFRLLETDTSFQFTSEINLFRGISALGMGRSDSALIYLQACPNHPQQAEWYRCLAYLKQDDQKSLAESLEIILAQPRHFYQEKAQELKQNLTSSK
ncbi:MAG: hypothetical protein AAF206_18570 [Bacteroidota bacterium]